MTRTILKLKIEGMHCDACVRRVTTSLQKLPTVHLDRVSVGEAQVDFDAVHLQPQAVVDAINAIGFQAQVVD